MPFQTVAILSAMRRNPRRIAAPANLSSRARNGAQRLGPDELGIGWPLAAQEITGPEILVLVFQQRHADRVERSVLKTQRRSGSIAIGVRHRHDLVVAIL